MADDKLMPDRSQDKPIRYRPISDFARPKMTVEEQMREPMSRSIAGNTTAAETASPYPDSGASDEGTRQLLNALYMRAIYGR